MKSGFAVGDAGRRQLASELFTIIKIEEDNYEKIDNVKEFVERIDSSKKLNPKDLSSDQDLTIAIMNLISIEEHLVFSGAKTNKNSFYDLIEEVRELRKTLMQKLFLRMKGKFGVFPNICWLLQCD